MKIQMMPRTATIHMAELVKLTSNPPADSGATSWISNCARGLCATASTLVFILPAVLADTGYLPNIPECRAHRSEEHTSELQSLMRISYAVFCLKKKTKNHTTIQTKQTITKQPHTQRQHY